MLVSGPRTKGIEMRKKIGKAHWSQNVEAGRDLGSIL